MDYKKWLEKTKSFIDVESGFDISIDTLNEKLKPFQKLITRWALKRGRAAVFANTGLGKTCMQIEWAHRINLHTGKNVLIVAPLCVSLQTVAEGLKFGIKINYARSQKDVQHGITVTNYEMIDHFDLSEFIGIVLDESSILKSLAGKFKSKIIELSESIPYRLSCTATPSPNDFMELGNQAEFLGVMGTLEMLSCFFTHDGGDTSKWRLKGHGKKAFWEWMSTWAVVVRHPEDLGFAGEFGYDLPPITYHHHVVAEDKQQDGWLIPQDAATLEEQRKVQRETITDRCQAVANLVNNSNEPWIVWCNLNDESSMLSKLIPDGVEVCGSDSISQKESSILGFSRGTIRVLITKTKIAGFGLNWQHCHNIAFAGITHSFEAYYQAVRRCWRYGQDKNVNVHVVTAESEGNVIRNLKRKEKDFDEMHKRMVSYMKELMNIKIHGVKKERMDYKREVITNNDFTLHLGDCVDVTNDMESNSIDFTVFSPPFSSLYVYTNSDRDMGNCKSDEEFMEHFQFLVKQLYRITKPGRLLSFHCMNLPSTKQHDGYIGIRDFRGELIRKFCDEGFIYHSEVTIWKDPVTAMQRTKAIGLLYKQLRKDSNLSRQGIPDYLVTMRKPGENQEPITKTPESFPVGLWQRYASPVWMDINPSKTLQAKVAREADDERHICPLQLEVIERAIQLWTNPGDLVFSPFTGIGSEGYVALQMDRRFVGCELKEGYYRVAHKNLMAALATRQQDTLFA